LDRFLAREPEIAFDLHDELRVIVAAARAVVEAPEIEWCEEHRGTRSTSQATFCATATVWRNGGMDPRYVGECRWGRVFLVPAEEES
jgi:hypothetical protein